MLLKAKSIFIVEDLPQNRVVFQMTLARHGALVDFERKGIDAAYKLSLMRRVDLIILDLMLAYDTSGFDVYKQIRDMPRFEKTPILAVSAMDFAVGAPKAMALGFSGFISKPIDPNLFPDQVAKVIRGKAVWDENNHVY